MACCGNYCLSLINSLLLILSLPFLAAGWIIKNIPGTPCNPVIYKPLILVGVFLLVLSLIGILGSCCRLKCFLWIYLILIVLLIILLAFFLIFGAANIKAGTSIQYPGKNDNEYRLQDFSSWLRDKMVDDGSWADIETCLKQHHACGKIEIVRRIVDVINLRSSKLSHIELGCCKPPSSCGFTYVNEDTWLAPKKGLNSTDEDCKLWRNEKDDLCYTCSSCKAGYLAQFMNYWKKLATLNISLLSFLIIVFLISCCALL